jgi:hypothetical protein
MSPSGRAKTRQNRPTGGFLGQLAGAVRPCYYRRSYWLGLFYHPQREVEGEGIRTRREQSV